MVSARQHEPKVTQWTVKSGSSPTPGSGSMSSAGSQILDRHTTLRLQGFFPWWLVRGRTASTPQSRGLAGPGSPPRSLWAELDSLKGCATQRVCHSSSGRMRSFLHDSSSFLMYRILKPLFSSPLCLLPDPPKNASVPDTPAENCPSWEATTKTRPECSSGFPPLPAV